MASKFIVNSLWISSSMGQLQQLCLNSFIQKECTFNLYTYGEVQNVPEGVVIKNANEIIESSYIFKDNKDSYATFSDWFRIKLLYEIGGWWVDCDVFCMKKFNFKNPYVFATEHVKHQNALGIQICNAILKMPRNSIIGKKILAKIEKRIDMGRLNEIYWTEIGANYITDVILLENEVASIYKPDVFCPINYFDYKDLAAKKETLLSNLTYGIHLWNAMWEWADIEPFDRVEKGSLLDIIKSSLVNK